MPCMAEFKLRMQRTQSTKVKGQPKAIAPSRAFSRYFQDTLEKHKQYIYIIKLSEILYNIK